MGEDVRTIELRLAKSGLGECTGILFILFISLLIDILNIKLFTINYTKTLKYPSLLSSIHELKMVLFFMLWILHLHQVGYLSRLWLLLLIHFHLWLQCFSDKLSVIWNLSIWLLHMMHAILRLFRIVLFIGLINDLDYKRVQVLNDFLA